MNYEFFNWNTETFIIDWAIEYSALKIVYCIYASYQS